MKIFKTVKSVLDYREKITKGKIGFIATRGDIHDGHKSLIKASLKNDTITVVSIFIDSSKLRRGDTLNVHLRSIEHDLDVLGELGVSAVFFPFYDEIFQAMDVFKVDPGIFKKMYCSMKYPDIYTESLTIFHKFMQIIRPDNIYLGKYNYPLFFLTKAMVKSFFMPVNIHILPIVRLASGLALSSHNAYLNEGDWKSASMVYQSLKKAGEYVEKEKVVTPKNVFQVFQKSVSAEKKISIEYFQAASRLNFMPVDEVMKGKAVLVTAVEFEKNKGTMFSKGSSIRLSDNIEV